MLAIPFGWHLVLGGWAFGAVLFESLVGKPPFRGEDTSESLAFVLTKEPPWGTLPEQTPAAIRRGEGSRYPRSAERCGRTPPRVPGARARR